jgi:ferritin
VQLQQDWLGRQLAEKMMQASKPEGYLENREVQLAMDPVPHPVSAYHSSKFT